MIIQNIIRILEELQMINELEMCSKENNPKYLKSEKYFSMISSL